jgi:hypothetical protein
MKEVEVQLHSFLTSALDWGEQRARTIQKHYKTFTMFSFYTAGNNTSLLKQYFNIGVTGVYLSMFLIILLKKAFHS